MRTVVACLMAAWFAIAALLAVTRVDKPSRPITGGAAALIVAIDALLIIGVLYLGGFL